MLQYLIVCPLVFLAGLMDFIAGGGGLIAPPTYLITGVSVYMALGTNKLSSTMGTTVPAAWLAEHDFLKGKVLMVVCSSAAALTGSALGAHLTLMVPESVIEHMMIVVLSVVTFYVLRNKDMGTRDGTEDIFRNRILTISMAAAFFMGRYDGSYGPGTGTFLIPILIGVAGMDIRGTPTQAEVINLSSSIATLVTSTAAGSVYHPLGFTVGVYSIAGHYIGVGMVAHDGQKVVRPVVLVVLGVLSIEIISNT